ncbi:hypothetical protein VN12_00230 [Pirellula sp. SH-Sr6A]|uniref:hypothetical protein n=1 Tax=Pirellula sp. SH-Sr6A TaxID=1632865 RepID=UPI00078C854C|nr:hypothetical protein [Pirellula sp. SH-Sr6A]AMV30508.1 hypothetical protein VN12_00230 [Pirellula sp. SH-Sr6A]
MICSLCSLLCDQPVLHDTCPRRLHELSQSTSPARDVLSSSPASLNAVLGSATSIHIGGRFHSVETSRAAIQLARAYQASIDGSHPSGMFDVTQAIAAHGAYLTTLAEARSTSDCLLVVNPEGMLEHFPQLPAVLNKHLLGGESGMGTEHSSAPKSEACVILIGSGDGEHRKRWGQHFSKVLDGPCDCESLPQVLTGLTRHEKDTATGLTAKAGGETQEEWMQQVRGAKYPVVIWGSIALPIPAIDLWAERMQTWFLQHNEHSRSSGLMLSPPASVFQHTCTWLTGFPSRLDFAAGVMRWDRAEASTDRWLERNRDNENALLIWIDESSEREPTTAWGARPDDRMQVIELVTQDRDSDSVELVPGRKRLTRQRIPIGRPGVDYPATVLRADQVVMAYPEGDAQLRRKELFRCDRWLQSMLPKEPRQ